MRKTGMSKGGYLFVFGIIGGAIFLGIYRLVTGHLPDSLDYALWGLIAASILTDAEASLAEALANSKDIKAKSKVCRSRSNPFKTLCKNF